MADVEKDLAQSNYTDRSERVAAILPPLIGVNSDNWGCHIANLHLFPGFESDRNAKLMPFAQIRPTTRRFFTTPPVIRQQGPRYAGD